MAKNSTDIDLSEVTVATAAEATDSKTEDPGMGEAKKRPPIFIALIALVAFLVLGGGGFFAYTKLSASSAEEPKEVKTVKATASGKEEYIGPIIALKPFIVNLADNGGKRYMKLNVEAELSGSEVNEELNKRMPQIRDSIILLLGNKQFDDIQDIGGKNKLREELIVRLNGLLKTGKIKNVYFTEFVVQ